jgi:translation initiation factor 3 subunit B
MIWDFKGTQLLHTPVDKFKQFLWRPRPPTLLTKDLQRKVRRELKEHSRAFDEQDQAEENRGTAEKRAQREREVAEWNAWRKRNIERLLSARKERGLELVKDESGPAEETVEEWIEDLVQETEEFVEL